MLSCLFVFGSDKTILIQLFHGFLRREMCSDEYYIREETRQKGEADNNHNSFCFHVNDQGISLFSLSLALFFSVTDDLTGKKYLINLL